MGSSLHEDRNVSGRGKFSIFRVSEIFSSVGDADMADPCLLVNAGLAFLGMQVITEFILFF